MSPVVWRQCRVTSLSSRFHLQMAGFRQSVNGTVFQSPRAFATRFNSKSRSGGQGKVRHCAKRQDQARVALFIDADHIGPSTLAPIVDAVSPLGSLVHCRVYVHAHNDNRWPITFTDLAVTPVVVPRALGGTKEPVDMAISWDVAELAQGEVSAVAIASDDLDFTLLHQRVRARGLRSYAVLRDRGIDRIVHDVLRRLTDGVVLYKPCERTRETLIKVSADFKELKPAFQIAEVDAQVKNDARPYLADMLDMLGKTGYWRRDTGKPSDGDPTQFNLYLLLAALARLHHVNKLGPLTISPLSFGITESHKLVMERVSWIHDPRNLAFIMPWRRPLPSMVSKFKGSYGTANLMSAGGPFLVPVGNNLAEEVLKGLNYMQGVDDLNGEALDLFIQNNIKHLTAYGFSFETTASKLDSLQRVFMAQDKVQRWRQAISDEGIRKILHSSGRLTSSHADQDDVFNAMGEFLADEAKMQTLPFTHAMRVAKMRQHLDKHQPTLRSRL